MTSVYTILSEFPGAKQIADAHLTHFKAVLSDASKSRYGREKAVSIRDAAKQSVGSVMPSKSLELKHTISLIRELNEGINYRMGAMILAEIGDFSRFDSPDKVLAYAGLSPSTYQSGKLNATGAYAHMEKRGSRYLRYALFNATRFVCRWNPTFASYLEKKRSEGKHYNVAISHAAKKLVRLIFALQNSGEAFRSA